MKGVNILKYILVKIKVEINQTWVFFSPIVPLEVKSFYQELRHWNWGNFQAKESLFTFKIACWHYHNLIQTPRPTELRTFS